PFQQLEVLGDGVQGDVEGRRDLGDAERSLLEPREDGPPRGIGEGGEGPAQPGLAIFNHLVEYRLPVRPPSRGPTAPIDGGSLTLLGSAPFPPKEAGPCGAEPTCSAGCSFSVRPRPTRSRRSARRIPSRSPSPRPRSPSSRSRRAASRTRAWGPGSGEPSGLPR